MNICENMIVGARLFATDVAITFEDHEVTYADLEVLSGHAAQQLVERGVQRGDRVGILIGNVPAFAVWYYAALRIGAVAVSVNTRLAAEEVAFILTDCDARVLIGTDATLSGLARPAAPSVAHQLAAAEDGAGADGRLLTESRALEAFAYEDTEPNEPATILYTSGTTGFPKGATLSHQNVRATVHAFNHLCEMRVGDRLLLAVPLFHCFGQNALLNSGLNVGATIVMQRRFDLNESKQLIGRHRVNRLFGVPTMFQLMLDACTPDDLASVEYCFTAAATMPAQVAERWREKFGLPIYEGYGLTETAPFASYNHRLKRVPGSIGVPVDLVEMKVVDPETGNSCPPGEPGEIAIRGPNVMLGYWNRPEDTAAAIRDGWFHSGDIGKTDEAGYYYLVDRLKDMISVGGMKVFPAEVERVLRDHPEVEDVAVVGLPDPVWGEQVAAFVVPPSGVSPDTDAVRNYCHEHLASYKSPATIHVVEALPRNPAGKVLKTVLRQENTAIAAVEDADSPRKAATSGRPPQQPAAEAVSVVAPPLRQQYTKTHPAGRERLIAAFLQDEIRSLLGDDRPLDPDSLLLDTGLDSLMMVQLADRIEAAAGPAAEFSPTMVFDHPRIRDLAKFVLAAMDAGPGKPAPLGQPKTDATKETTSDAIDKMSEQQALEALLREIDE